MSLVTALPAILHSLREPSWGMVSAASVQAKVFPYDPSPIQPWLADVRGEAFHF